MGEDIECMFVCVCIYVRGGKGGWEEFSEGNEHHYVMHAHAHPQARRFESKSFRNAKQQCPHASASPAPGNRGGRRLLEGVRHCPMFVHALSLSAVAMSFLFQVGGRGSGKEGGGRTHSNPARSSCIPPRTLSRTKATSPITSGRRAPRSFTTSFLAESAARPRKARRTSERGASLWCSRQMRQGIRVAFWQYDSTTASKPCVYMYIFIYFFG